MKKFFLIILIFNLNFNIAKSLEADVFVQSTVNRASEILSKNISKEEKINELKVIAKETVDIKGVGFYSLGSARKNLDDIIEYYVQIAKLHILKKRMKVMGKYFQPKNDDEQLMKKLKNFKG